MLGWGIIGPGRIADTAMAPAINALPDNRLAAVVSRDRGRADASYAHAATRAQEQAATIANELLTKSTRSVG